MGIENNARIKTEKDRLRKIFKNLPTERKKTVEKLVERAAFMLISLENMENEINSDGLITEMVQGKYTIERAHPLLSTYNTMIKNYAAVTKQLCDNLPDSEQEKAGQDIMNFVAKPK